MNRIKRNIKHAARIAAIPWAVAICAAAMLASACTKDKDEPTLSLNKPATPIEFTAAATETFVYEVKTNQQKWDVVSDQTWCKIVKTAASFMVKADENFSTEAPAPATITVSAGNAKPIVIKVTQKAADALLSLSSDKTDIVFTAEATEKFVYEVKTNQELWAAKSNQEWCRVTMDDNNFMITAEPTTSTTAPLPATITVSAGNARPIIIKAVQKPSGPFIKLTPATTKVEFTAEAKGQVFGFEIETNQQKWNAVSDQNSWCVVTIENNTFRITAKPNEAAAARSATVTVTGGEAEPVKIAVTQAAAGPSLSLDNGTAPIQFSAEATEKFTYIVKTNQSSWDAKSNQSWCTVDKTEDGFVVSAQSNQTTTPSPEATITVTAGKAKALTIKVTQVQADATLSLDKPTTDVEFTAEATETISYGVITNQKPWDAVSSQDWLKVTKSATSFALSATPNTTTTAPPAATVTISAGNAKQITIRVTQKAAAPSLTITPMPENGELQIPLNGESYIYTVTTNQDSWSVTSNNSWCTVKKNAEGMTFTVTGAYNGFPQSRSATITVKAGNAPEVVFTAKQDARPVVEYSEDKRPLPENFSEGTGSLDFPYLIKTAGHMRTFHDEVDFGRSDGKYYRLEVDVRVTLTVPLTYNSDRPFKGHLDGNGHTISGSLISYREYTGLFSIVEGSIRNLKVDMQIENSRNDLAYNKHTRWTGAIAALLQGNGVISGCTVRGSIKGALPTTYVFPTPGTECWIITGGVAGALNGNASIQSCTNYATVNGGGANSQSIVVSLFTYTGGIAGETQGGTKVSYCTNNGTIAVGSNVYGWKDFTGGIVGRMWESNNVHKSQNHGAVNNSINAGGKYTGGVAGGFYTGILVHGIYTCNTNDAKVNGQAPTGTNLIGRGEIKPCPDHN